MVKVSVIIPCYNVEPYISDCLKSVCAQTLQEIEVICIDDGSTDGTLNILEEYRSQNNNLYIISQKNQGSGIARNHGIDVATGEYLAFMDADDFYPAQDTLEKMYCTAKREKAEICGGSGCTFRNGIYTYSGSHFQRTDGSTKGIIRLFLDIGVLYTKGNLLSKITYIFQTICVVRIHRFS